MLQVHPIKAVIFVAAFFSSVSAFSQIQFKLHWMEADQQWGVFARLEEGVELNMYTIVGSGQVTLVAPVGTSFKSLESVSGEWVQNAFITAPKENPEVDYISFGLVSNIPEIILQKGEETLLFTFAKRQEECPEFLSLIENKTDPLAQYPNSANANAGNDLSIMDPSNTKVYNYTSNYMPKAWDCNPGKAIALNDYRTGKERYRPQIIKP